VPSPQLCTHEPEQTTGIVGEIRVAEEEGSKSTHKASNTGYGVLGLLRQYVKDRVSMNQWVNVPFMTIQSFALVAIGSVHL